MSLAQRVDRYAAVESLATPAAAPRTAIPVDFRDITRRAAGTPATSPATVLSPALAAAIEARPAARRPADPAFDLLDEVARLVPTLLERIARLEAELAISREMTRTEVETAGEVAREWQQIAGALKSQVEGLENGLSAMRNRAESAEERSAALRQETERSQHAAAEAECLSSLFRDKVISSFGAASPIHPMLEVFRTRDAGQGA